MITREALALLSSRCEGGGPDFKGQRGEHVDFFRLHARCVVSWVVRVYVPEGSGEESRDAARGRAMREEQPRVGSAGGGWDSAGSAEGRAGPGRAGRRCREPAAACGWLQAAGTQRQAARWEEAGGAEEEEEGARRCCGAYQPVLDYGAARLGLTRRHPARSHSLPAARHVWDVRPALAGGA